MLRTDRVGARRRVQELTKGRFDDEGTVFQLPLDLGRGLTAGRYARMADDQNPMLLLDACVVLNLYASGHMAGILASIPERAGIVDIVQRESLFVRRGGDRDGADEREAVNPLPLIESGLIQVISAATEVEFETFVDLSRHLDDGEAMTSALALTRSCHIATDDRAAIRIIASRVPTISSLGLLQGWVNHQGISSDIANNALMGVRRRASCMPGQRHALCGWWDDLMSEP